MTPCSVRAVSEWDAAAISDILNAIIATGSMTIMTAPFTVEDQRSYIRAFPERGVYHVAVHESTDAVVGVQGVEPLSHEPALRHVGDISTFVALNARRSGIGRALCAVTEVQASKRDFSKLMATVRADNVAAVAFYESLGYRRIGCAIRHARLGDRFVDEVFLEKLL